MTNGSRNLKRRFGPLVVALATTVGLMALAAPSASGATPVVSNYSGVGISEPNAIAAGPDGALWFTNYRNNSIGRITTAGRGHQLHRHRHHAPDGIAAGPDGALWFTNFGNNSIGRITTAGVVTNYTGTGIVHPDGITAGPDGALWFTNSGTTRSGGSPPPGRSPTTPAPASSNPYGITAGPDGALWFTNFGNNSIGRITTAGCGHQLHRHRHRPTRTRSPPAPTVPCGSPTTGTTRSGGSRPPGW